VLEASSSVLKVRQGTLDALCILPGLGDTQRGVHDADVEEDAGALEEEVRDGDGHLGGQHPREGGDPLRVEDGQPGEGQADLEGVSSAYGLKMRTTYIEGKLAGEEIELSMVAKLANE
jgi:hypothetical protein